MSDRIILDAGERWEKGVPHHRRSREIMEHLERIDFGHNGDYFCWKSGGDGDNGETLMYELDSFFEAEGLATTIDCQERDIRNELRPVPKSIIGKCVGHHPDRRIYRDVEMFGNKRLIRAHPGSSIEEGDLWRR